jgi:L-ascorbate metabolism protein UlaG (beta-lactamase superfamily)
MRERCRLYGLSGTLAAIVIAALAASACTGIDPAHDQSLLPRPARDFAVAGVAIGSALGLHPRDGIPEIRPLATEAYRDNRLTWLGHSSFLLGIGGRSFLLDPMFSNRPELPAPIRPRRLPPVPPGINKLDRLDAVVISHADHDHLDLPTLRALASRFPDARLLVPAGTAKIASTSGFQNVSEFDVYQAARIGPVRLTALPARHYSRRDMIGLNRRLAVGWEIAASGRKIYFSGDTGFNGLFDDIRERRGRFDIALVPIGGFSPPAAFEDVHASPEEAVMIASKLGARLAIAHHWGTFSFGAASPREAQQRFLAARAPGVTPVALAIGETIRIDRR